MALLKNEEYITREKSDVSLEDRVKKSWLKIILSKKKQHMHGWITH